MFKRKKKQPNSAKLIEQFRKGEITYEQAAQQINLHKLVAEVDEVENKSKDQSNIVDLRYTWGKVILGILILTILCDFFLVWKVGSGAWKFEGNSYFLNVVVTEHLIQIFGLVLIVLKFLFPNGSKEK